MGILLLCSTAAWGQKALMQVPDDREQDKPAAVSRPAQGDTIPDRIDSLAVTPDGAPSDSAAGMPDGRSKVRISKSLSGPVKYQSADSMIMMSNGTAYLHGKGDLKYQSMQLTSDYIRMNMDSNLIYAHGVWDSLEYEWKGKPVFKDGKDEYETNELT